MTASNTAEQQLISANQKLLAKEQQLRIANHKLAERVKELACLHGLSHLVDSPDSPDSPDSSMESILQGICDLIRESWQYPEITTVRITVDNDLYETANFVASQCVFRPAVCLLYQACRYEYGFCSVPKWFSR